jgi:hypothetical protein
MMGYKQRGNKAWQGQEQFVLGGIENPKIGTIERGE